MRSLAGPLLAVVVLAAAGCASTANAPETVDIVSNIPWRAPETHTYKLTDDNKPKGTTTLSVTQDGDKQVLTQRSEDGQGNSDEAVVTVDAATLKPISSVRTIIDASEKRVAESVYEATSGGDCSSGQVVRIKQSTFKPPDEPTPDSTRSNPLCMPDHSYENDSSLFIWRTMTFEKGYTITYNTVIAARRDTQAVTLRVADRVKKTPGGDADAWLVEISADNKTQRAWFATTEDHMLLAYQNDSVLFTLADQGAVPAAQPSRTARQVVVRWTPSARWMPSVMALPSLSRSSASSWTMTSKGPVTVSTAVTRASTCCSFRMASPTAFALPTSASMSTYPRTDIASSLVSRTPGLLYRS
jgi:hypothetical protein